MNCVRPRPSALSEEDLPELPALMRDLDVPVQRICERLDISKAPSTATLGPMTSSGMTGHEVKDNKV